jgi:hypothetical protein
MASMKDRAVRQTTRPAPDFASFGWIVEADLADAGKPPDRRFFAVGLAKAHEAVEAVLHCPGMMRRDKRFALRPLSPEEIARLKLRARAVRPYGWAVKGEAR